MCFKQERAFSILSGKHLKLVDQLTYLGSNISFTESDVNICIAKALIAIDSISIIWKSERSDKNKTGFLPSWGCVGTIVWMPHLDANETHREKARWKLRKNAMCCFEQILKATPYKTKSVRPLTFYLTNKTNKTCWTLLVK